MPAEPDPLSETPEIRRTLPQDAHQVWEILQAAPQAAEWSETSIRNSLLDKQTIALVSVVREKILGCIFGLHICGEAEILNLAVHSLYRRRRIAQALVSQLLAAWHQQGVKRVFLEVRESNAPAIKLYEGLGFCPVGRRKAYYSSPEEDALVLELPRM